MLNCGSVGLVIYLLCYLSFSNADISKDETQAIYIVNSFTPPNAVFYHLAIDESLGYVYVGAKNRSASKAFKFHE